ncbi:conserved exported hypothetical protein [Sphingomonas sp. EC-HK361]|jgi:flagella basal body P-ring formation protein FlgA|uniref:hypothetical protein n=1 Tax=Sphingomonas sp. EC-HK361 TaxID=2038397 RepID=UPI0012521DBD|nr:hypothetical protein [Sphingomonas sp. EC-HK361]VVT06736.1 conserved exported hypothetical protein [Sphingomonas sp. EC-HK361]
MTRFLTLAALAVATPALAAPGFQDTTAIDRGVAGFTGQAIGAIGGARTEVDSRLRLKTCPMVTMAWRSEAHDAVVVSCTGPDWRIFVPVRAAPAIATPVATGAITAPAAKPVVVIKRGDPILVEAGGSGFAIQRDGVAMGDAPAGGRFLVKIDGAKGPIQAVAVEAGRATLPGWSE